MKFVELVSQYTSLLYIVVINSFALLNSSFKEAMNVQHSWTEITGVIFKTAVDQTSITGSLKEYDITNRKLLYINEMWGYHSIDNEECIFVGYDAVV